MSKKYNVCVVGVGAVGIEMLRILRERNFPMGELRIFARSSREIEVDGQKYPVKAISPEGFEGIDIALFAGTEGEKGAAVTYAPEAIRRGTLVIDNGADFRMDPAVPLVVPEVNVKDIKKHKGLIANPNCSTIQMVVALAPIHSIAKIARVIVSSYQAASGAGRGAVEQLWAETQEIIHRRQKTEDRRQKICHLIRKYCRKELLLISSPRLVVLKKQVILLRSGRWLKRRVRLCTMIASGLRLPA